jgi:dienelactone hydrolase
MLFTLLFCATAASRDDPAARFSYDGDAPLGLEVSPPADGIQTITYLSPKGGRVPATLVQPRGTKSDAAVIFMHWGLGDRTSFLDEAVTLGHSGVTSILIDAPWLRPGYRKRSDVDDLVQLVVDLRRAVDVLQSRSSVKLRIGYAGLSLGAWTGAILSAVEPRIEAFVLAGGLASNSEAEQQPALAWLDAEKWVSKSKAPIFLQFSIRDEYISREQARRYDRATPQPHINKWYEGGHELNVASRRDRASWLGSVLGFTLPEGEYKPVGLPEKPLSTFGAYREIAKLGVVIEIPGMQHVRVRRDIVWKGELKMDVYYPPTLAAGEIVPAIVSLPGQAPPDFMRSVRHMRFSTTFARALAARCLRIVIVPDLRSASEADVARDVDDLVTYVREHAPELQIDRDALAIVFRSAGWSYGFRAALRGAPSYVKAVVAWYGLLGPYDQATQAHDPVQWLGQDKPLPPVLLVTAQHDGWYNEAATRRFLDAAAEAKVKVTHVHLANGGHAFELGADLEESRQAVLKTMLFLREALPVRRD